MAIPLRQRGKQDIEQNLKSGRIPRWAAILMLVARPIFSLLTQLLVAAGFKLRRHPEPLRAAAQWWIPSGTLIDLMCLATLLSLTRREGVRFTEMFGVQRERLGRDLLLAPVDLVALAPAVGIGSLLTRLFYGTSEVSPQVSVVHGLPKAASAYSVIVWPAIWSVTEEATYLGYTLPRLEALTGNSAASAAIVSVVWALQHEGLPLLPNWRYLAYRFLTALPITLSLTLLYLLQGRRLLPLIVTHWVSDTATALLAVTLRPTR